MTPKSRKAERSQNMVSPTQSQEVVTKVAGKAVEAFALWADANQKVLRQMVDLSASTAKEGVRLYAEISSSAVEAVKDTQSYLERRQSEWQGVPGDPLSYYQKNLVDSVEGVQKAFKMLEGNAQAITRSAERLQVTAEQAGKEIQATFAELAGKVQSLYSPSA